MSQIYLTNENEFSKLISSGTTSIVYFFAPWCGPCKSFGPIFEKAAHSTTHMILKKLDIDELPEIAADYGIQAVPTFIVFKHGKELERHEGIINLNELIKKYDN